MAVGNSFTIVLMCDLRAPFPPPNGSVLLTKISTGTGGICDINAFTASQKGCPLQCPLGPNGIICSGNGNCGYDTNAAVSRCFCDTGFVDGNCISPPAPTNSTRLLVGIIVGGVVGGVAILAALGGAFWCIRRRRIKHRAAVIDGNLQAAANPLLEKTT